MDVTLALEIGEELSLLVMKMCNIIIKLTKSNTNLPLCYHELLRKVEDVGSLYHQLPQSSGAIPLSIGDGLKAVLERVKSFVDNLDPKVIPSVTPGLKLNYFFHLSEINGLERTINTLNAELRKQVSDLNTLLNTFKTLDQIKLDHANQLKYTEGEMFWNSVFDGAQEILFGDIICRILENKFILHMDKTVKQLCELYDQFDSLQKYFLPKYFCKDNNTDKITNMITKTQWSTHTKNGILNALSEAFQFAIDEAAKLRIQFALHRFNRQNIISI